MFRPLGEIFPSSSIRELLVTNTPGWTANNPSIARSSKGYKFTVRSSNFVLDPSGLAHQSTDPQGVIRTINYIGNMDHDMRILDLQEIDTSHVDGPVLYPPVRGMEDCRVWRDLSTNQWKVSGSFRQHRGDGIPTIAVDTLGDEWELSISPGAEEEGALDSRPGQSGNVVVDRAILRGDDPNQFEKNWMPTGHGNRFLRGPWSHPALEGHQLRGSSQAILLKDFLYYGVLHFVTWPGRCYWHCFGTFNWNGELLQITEPFHFLDPGVEFANGMAIQGDQFVVTFGYKEARCFMAFVPIDDVIGGLL